MTDDQQRTVLVAHPGAELFGSDRMLLESVRGLLATGARIVVALPSRGFLDVELRAAGAEVVVIPMLVLRKVLLTPRGLPQLLRDGLRGWGATWRLIGRVRPDAVYVSTIIIPQWPLIARTRRVRTVSHVHEAEASGNPLVNHVLYAPHLASHRAVTNSQHSLETIRSAHRRLAQRSDVVYNGIASPARPQAPRERLDGPIRVLYVGRLSPRKGPHVVIDAAALLHTAGRDVEVTLLGAVFEGYEWYEDELRTQAARAGVPVEFAGFQPDIWPFLAATDVLVVPSLADESFGNIAVEGILALRPTIVSDSSGLREAAGGYATTQLIAPGDPVAIAEGLSRIEAEWERMVAGVGESRAEALRRHAPDVYRAQVSSIVLDNATRPHQRSDLGPDASGA